MEILQHLMGGVLAIVGGWVVLGAAVATVREHGADMVKVLRGEEI